MTDESPVWLSLPIRKYEKDVFIRKAKEGIYSQDIQNIENALQGDLRSYAPWDRWGINNDSGFYPNPGLEDSYFKAFPRLTNGDIDYATSYDIIINLIAVASSSSLIRTWTHLSGKRIWRTTGNYSLGITHEKFLDIRNLFICDEPLIILKL